jgi:hypothetical protein
MELENDAACGEVWADVVWPSTRCVEIETHAIVTQDALVCGLHSPLYNGKKMRTAVGQAGQQGGVEADALHRPQVMIVYSMTERAQFVH